MIAFYSVNYFEGSTMFKAKGFVFGENCTECCEKVLKYCCGENESCLDTLKITYLSEENIFSEFDFEDNFNTKLGDLKHD